jgi:hypothetical protein
MTVPAARAICLLAFDSVIGRRDYIIRAIIAAGVFYEEHIDFIVRADDLDGRV